MENEPLRIMLVEDTASDVKLLEYSLRSVPGLRFRLIHVGLLKDVRQASRTQPFDVMLLDLSLPDSRGLDTVVAAQEYVPGAPIIVLTGADDEELGVEAVRRGAQDYLVKGEVDGWALARAIRYAIERKRAQEEIRTLNTQLERRVAERTAVAEQRASQIRALALELAQAEDGERHRLAEAIHDRLQQLLFAAKLGVDAAQRHIAAEPAARRRTAGELPGILGRIESLLTEAIREARSLTCELSPPVLREEGLPAALRWLGEWMGQAHQLDVRVEAEEGVLPDNEHVSSLLFQVVRELLFNVVKHAGVKTAQVRLSRAGISGPEADEVRIVVADEGAGFDPASPPRTENGDTGGFGLSSVRKRLELIGGRLAIDSAPGRGSRLILTAPLHWAEVGG